MLIINYGHLYCSKDFPIVSVVKVEKEDGFGIYSALLGFYIFIGIAFKNN